MNWPKREQITERLKRYLTHEEANYQAYRSAVRDILSCVQRFRKSSERLLANVNPSEHNSLVQELTDAIDTFEEVFRDTQLDLGDDRQLVHHIKAQCVSVAKTLVAQVAAHRSTERPESLEQPLDELKQLQNLLVSRAQMRKVSFEKELQGSGAKQGAGSWVAS